jgi:hypothetical protein
MHGLIIRAEWNHEAQVWYVTDGDVPNLPFRSAMPAGADPPLRGFGRRSTRGHSQSASGHSAIRGCDAQAFECAHSRNRRKKV